MTDFNELLNRKGSEVKEPVLLPPGPFRFKAEKTETGLSSEKKTPYIRVHFRVVEALEGVDTEALAAITDLTKKTVRDDFYLTEDAEIRFIRFAKACGIEGVDDMTLKEIMAKVPGHEVVGHVKHDPVRNPRPDSPKFRAIVDRYASIG